MLLRFRSRTFECLQRLLSGDARAGVDSAKRAGRLATACLWMSVWTSAAGVAGAFPEIGVLQFKVEHNLETPACLASGSCFLEFEELDQPAPWLAEIRTASTLGVLHWDRGIPWLAFDPNPPPGVSRVAFYETRLDASTVNWINAYASHFQLIGKSYVAVSILNGARNGLAPLMLGPGDTRDVAGLCPSFSPGTTFVVDPGTGPVAFDLERSYRNFLLYLFDKLGPDYFGLMVEANLIEESCAGSAPSLYALYRSLHDEIEGEIGSSPLLFATLSYPPLLDYAREACFPTAAFQPCGSPPPPSPPNAGIEACFPMQLGPIDALNQGGRLDVLALSFYPDSLEMNPLPSEVLETRYYPLADWNAGAVCDAALAWPDVFDPMAGIARLGWTGPIAIAETSARSCPSPLRFDLPGLGPSVLEVDGTPTSQAAWTDRTLQSAIDHDALFYLHSFMRDYPPVGVWTVGQGVIPVSAQSIFNIWPCSGLQDVTGALKPEMEAIGLPEPGLVPGLVSGFALLLAAGGGRKRA